MRYYLNIIFLFGLLFPMSAQRVEDFLWRVQGVDTLPAWVMQRTNGELGVSLPRIDSVTARSQSISHAAINYLLHKGISANSVEEMFLRETPEGSIPHRTERMIKSDIDFRFDYDILNTHVSPFGEIFTHIDITESAHGACRISGDLTLYYNYNFTNVDNWRGYYLLNLSIEGLDSLREEKIEMYRVQHQSEINVVVNDTPWSRMGVYCTYEEVNDTITIPQEPEQWLVKGFWNPYLFMQLNSIFYEIGSASIIKSVSEIYNEEYRELSRQISQIKVAVDTEIQGIVDNCLKMNCEVRQLDYKKIDK